MSDALDRLYAAIASCRGQDPALSKTARQLAASRKRIARKIGGGAVEGALAATRTRPDKVIAESADLLHHLLVLWVAMGIPPEEVATELARRARPLAAVTKLPRRAA